MNLADDRDEWIMVQAAHGKPQLLEILVRRHASPLLTFIHRMVDDRHRSQEITRRRFGAGKEGTLTGKFRRLLTGNKGRYLLRDRLTGAVIG